MRIQKPVMKTGEDSEIAELDEKRKRLKAVLDKSDEQKSEYRDTVLS